MSRREYLTDLRAACTISDGRTHLGEFCDRHAVEVGEVAVSDGYEIPGSVEVIHVPGYEPESPQSIICDLIDEIDKLTEAAEKVVETQFGSAYEGKSVWSSIAALRAALNQEGES